MNYNEKIEKMIADAGLVAPRITEANIKNKIADVSYTTLPSGKVMVCEITLINGFTVRGEAAVVSIANFRENIGREISYRNAFDKIWELEGYLLQERLFNEANT